MDSNFAQENNFSQETYPLSPRKNESYAGSYRLIKKIQIGGQASIYLAMKQNDCFALKIYQKSEREDKDFENQLKILQRLEYKGIVPIAQTIANSQFRQKDEDEKIVHIIAMPFMEKGDLLEWIHQNGQFTESIGRFFIQKLISTFLYLYSKHVFHRDIKPQNILLGQNYLPLLLDFGLSVDSKNKAHNFVGDIRYASPQVIKHIEYTQKSEVYSLGILLFYITTKCFPFTCAKVSDTSYRLLLERKYQQFWKNIQGKINKELTTGFKQIFLKMISPSPDNRPSLEETIASSWFKSNNITQDQYCQFMESKYYQGK